MKKKIILLGLVLSIFLLTFVQSQTINPEDYLYEFNEQGENCEIIDGYFYSDYNNNLGFTGFYKCCVKDNCINLPFDVYNKRIYDGWDTAEQFHINYMRTAIKEGIVKPSEHFPESFDFCSYFSGKLNDQEVALVVKTADKVKKYAPQNYKKIYDVARGVGVSTGIITEFDIGVFVVTVGCNHLSKQEEEAFFKAGECYQYLQSIESGTTNYKINSQVSQCMSEAEVQLNSVLNSWAQQLKGALNTVVATGKALWSWGKEVVKGDLNAKIEIDPTSYDVAKGIRDKIQIEKIYLINPDEYSLTQKSQERFYLKSNQSEKAYLKVLEEYNEVNDNIPYNFNEFISNIFLNPNTDYSLAREKKTEAKNNIIKMEEFIELKRFNSAIKVNSTALSLINESHVETGKQQQIEQSVDWVTIIIFILIVLTGIYFLLRKII